MCKIEIKTIGGKKIVSRIFVQFNSVDLTKIAAQYNTPRRGLKIEGLTNYLTEDASGVSFYCDKQDCGEKRKKTRGQCYACLEKHFNSKGPVEIIDWR